MDGFGWLCSLMIYPLDMPRGSLIRVHCGTRETETGYPHVFFTLNGKNLELYKSNP